MTKPVVKMEQLAGAWLGAAEWTHRAEALEQNLADWYATGPDESDVELDDILSDAQILYGLSEHDAEMCLELMQFPMKAPSFADAAMVILVIIAVREAGIGWDGIRLDHRNLVWLSEGCWCWDQASANPRCPQHFPLSDR